MRLNKINYSSIVNRRLRVDKFEPSFVFNKSDVAVYMGSYDILCAP